MVLERLYKILNKDTITDAAMNSKLDFILMKKIAYYLPLKILFWLI